MAGLSEPRTCCPYTGNPIEYEALDLRSGFWTVRGALDTGMVFRDVAHAAAMLSMRAGSPGGGDPGKLRCPYTGRAVRLVPDGRGGIRAEGAFNPARVYLTLQEARWYVSHRNGQAPAFPREAPASPGITTREIEPPPSDPTVGYMSGNGDAVREDVERTFHGMQHE